CINIGPVKRIAIHSFLNKLRCPACARDDEREPRGHGFQGSKAHPLIVRRQSKHMGCVVISVDLFSWHVADKPYPILDTQSARLIFVVSLQISGAYEAQNDVSS